MRGRARARGGDSNRVGWARPRRAPCSIRRLHVPSRRRNRARPARGSRLQGFGAMTLRPVLIVAISSLALSCSPDVHDGVGPRTPSGPPNVTGVVVRANQPVASTPVSLRNPQGGAQIARTVTDAAGGYGLHAPVGVWEVRVAGSGPDDFATVTREFTALDPSVQFALPPLELSAFGSHLDSPVSDAQLTGPTPGQPIAFEWQMPSRPVVSARVQLYASNGEAVWYSAKTTEGSAIWNGLGTEGSQQGRLTGAGTYAWRVKFEWADSSESRLATWALILK